MISIEEALDIIHSQHVSLAKIELPLTDARGYCLAENITAPFNLPSFNNSAMDGYAVCGTTNTYELVGEVAAGNPTENSLHEGEAIRIFTGGKVPGNTTAVIMQEKTKVDGSTLTIDDTVDEGKNIRRQGEELRKSEQVFKESHVVTPATIGLIGSLGIETVNVYSKPAVRLIVTGNELLALGEPRTEGQIYESNSLAINAALEQYGFSCKEKQQIPDDFDQIKAGIATYLANSDVLILSGGISVGDYDYVKQALLDNGVEQLFYKVYQKPGKPLFFGRKKDTFVFALPGNPASSLTCFYIHVLPLLQKMNGSKITGLQKSSIPLAHDYHQRSDRPVFLKARVEQNEATILDHQGSSMIHSMALGNALVFIDKPKQLKKGDPVTCLLI